MTRHILILSGNLAGLITALRLIPYGFRISILDDSQFLSPEAVRSPFGESLSPEHSGFSFRRHSGEIPLLLHGFYHVTRSLFDEIAFEQTFLSSQLVDMEFRTSDGLTTSLPKLQWLSHVHPIVRLAFFRGLSWSDRWHLINFLEKKWEHHVPSDPNSDTISVETWLISTGQSDRAQKEIWNPLCRYFLGCDVTRASLGYFLEILARFCLAPFNGPETFLGSSDLFEHLRQKIRGILKGKKVHFILNRHPTSIHTGTDSVEHISLSNGERLSADAYVSSLPPAALLRLLPDRAPARFSCFSHLSQLQAVTGIAVQFTVNGSSFSPRLLLNSGLFDWITVQTPSDDQRRKTIITCVNMSPHSSSAYTDQWLNDTAWAHVRHVLNLSLVPDPSSQDLEMSQFSFPYYPCQTGCRTFRPISTTPLRNFFLTGPWTATPLPSCLESTVISAFACGTSRKVARGPISSRSSTPSATEDGAAR